MTINKLLIIEDNTAEAIWAQHDAIKAGIRDFFVATNLSDALKYLPQVDAVVSDLFFPAGSTATDQYIQRFLPYYESFKEDTFTKIGKDDPIYLVMEEASSLLGITPQRYVEEIMASRNLCELIMDSARSAVYGIRKYSKYLEFQKIEENIRSGRNLPLGIIVAEQAKERDLASVIVTSTHHHSDQFAPVKGLISSVPYFDTSVEGRKNWKAGIDTLLRMESESKIGRIIKECK